jgi:pimeloyl-ACP methyl ester carboxylesterase
MPISIAIEALLVPCWCGEPVRRRRRIMLGQPVEGKRPGGGPASRRITMPVARINGIDMYFERHGDEGEPLVLVHGYTGDVTDWRFQSPEFARTHRVLIMDHRGHGRSEAPSDRTQYSIDLMADDIEALVAETGFDRYHLLGHSMGGAVAQEIAIRSPQKLMSLTLHDTGYNFTLHRSAIVQKYIAMRQKIAEEQGMAAVAAIPSPIQPPPHMPAERREEEKQRMSRMSVDGFIGAWNALTGWQGTKDRIANVTVPTMVIYGDLDKGLIPAANWLAETIPGATLEIVPEAGHSPQYERPDLFNAALRRHLARNASSPAK